MINSKLFQIIELLLMALFLLACAFIINVSRPANNISLIHFVLFFIFGAILGLKYFFEQKKAIGKWKFQLSRFFIFIVPAIIVEICIHIHSFPYNMVYVNIISANMLNILIGYLIVTNFTKE